MDVRKLRAWALLCLVVAALAVLIVSAVVTAAGGDQLAAEWQRIAVIDAEWQ